MDGNAHRPTNLRYLLNQADDFGYRSDGTTPGMSPGGDVEVYKAGAALNVGDVVYFSGVCSVDKSITAATTLGKLAGVVVGGAKTDMRALTRKEDTGVQAAAAGEAVLVQVRGKCYVVVAAGLTAGALVAADTTTAGRVKAGAHTTDLVAGNSGNLVGNVLETTTNAGDKSLLRLNLQ